MPRATVVFTPEKFFLKTLADPEDPGYVELRRMSYGELLESQDLAFQIQMQAQNKTSGRDSDAEASVKVSQAAIASFQMRLCVMGHNLTGENDQPLNFKSETDISQLDPNVGQEITSLIDKIHNWKENYPNSQKPSTSELLAVSGPATQVASPLATPSQVVSPTT